MITAPSQCRVNMTNNVLDTTCPIPVYGYHAYEGVPECVLPHFLNASFVEYRAAISKIRFYKTFIHALYCEKREILFGIFQHPYSSRSFFLNGKNLFFPVLSVDQPLLPDILPAL